MISTNEPRMSVIPLRDVCFFSELPVLLGISDEYARKLTSRMTGPNAAWYEEQRFPDPFHVSEGGVRVWFVRDVQNWALGIRRKATGLRKRKGVPILDSPDLLNELLGL